MPITNTRWLMRFFKIRLVYLTFELFSSNPGKFFFKIRLVSLAFELFYSDPGKCFFFQLHWFH